MRFERPGVKIDAFFTVGNAIVFDFNCREQSLEEGHVVVESKGDDERSSRCSAKEKDDGTAVRSTRRYMEA